MTKKIVNNIIDLKAPNIQDLLKFIAIICMILDHVALYSRLHPYPLYKPYGVRALFFLDTTNSFVSDWYAYSESC